MSLNLQNVRDIFGNLLHKIEERKASVADPTQKEQLEWFVKIVSEEQATFKDELLQQVRAMKTEVDHVYEQLNSNNSEPRQEPPVMRRIE